MPLGLPLGPAGAGVCVLELWAETKEAASMRAAQKRKLGFNLNLPVTETPPRANLGRCEFWSIRLFGEGLPDSRLSQLTIEACHWQWSPLSTAETPQVRRRIQRRLKVEV